MGATVAGQKAEGTHVALTPTLGVAARYSLFRTDETFIDTALHGSNLRLESNAASR